METVEEDQGEWSGLRRINVNGVGGGGSMRMKTVQEDQGEW